MKRILTAFLATIIVFNCSAQQTRQRLSQIVASSSVPTEPQEKNFQLELTMSRGGKTATYRMALNGGQISTDLLDELSDQSTNSEPRTISFSVSLTLFEQGGGGEASVFVGRNIHYRMKPSGQIPNQEREVVQQRSMGLTTKIALRPAKAVVLFDDEEEKITLKLTEL